MRHDGLRALADGFLVVPEAQVDVVLRQVTGTHECVDGLEDRHERTFVVERSPAPEHLIVVIADQVGAERGMVPPLLGRGDDVVVRHEHGGGAGLTSGPAVEHRVSCDERALECRVEVGVEAGYGLDESVEMLPLGGLDVVA